MADVWCPVSDVLCLMSYVWCRMSDVWCLISYVLRLWLQVSTQQGEMDSKFVAMKRTIALLEKYDQKLPEMTQKFYTAAPQRCVVT